ncbi:MAG TPA: helix-turn-helix domain-containing protein [Polyangiaceae bacterium]|nr:helix-turn-helix domain-containing protein [Polyangiaceae bacterium]
MPSPRRHAPGRHCPGLCPNFQVALDAVAKPWSGQILLALREGPLRYAELAERLPPLGDRMLSLRLKELEAWGLLSRRVSPEPPVRVSYELSAAGAAFDQVAHALSDWGQRLRDGRPDAADAARAKGGEAKAATGRARADRAKAAPARRAVVDGAKATARRAGGEGATARRAGGEGVTARRAGGEGATTRRAGGEGATARRAQRPARGPLGGPRAAPRGRRGASGEPLGLRPVARRDHPPRLVDVGDLRRRLAVRRHRGLARLP